MEKLLLGAFDFIEKTYKVKETDIEIINLENEYLLRFDDEKLTFRAIKFYYNKDGKPSYTIESEIKVDDEVKIIDDKNPPKAPPKKPDPIEKGQNFALDSLKETIADFEKNEDMLLTTISELEKEIFNLKKGGTSEIEKLKKDYAELERKYNRDKKVSSEVAQYIKSMESRKKITQEQIDLIRKLLKEGKTQTEIVKLSNTSNGTVWRVKTNQI